MISVFNNISDLSGVSPTNYTFILPDGQYTPTKLIDQLKQEGL
jgi:hypothetical protein